MCVSCQSVDGSSNERGYIRWHIGIGHGCMMARYYWWLSQFCKYYMVSVPLGARLSYMTFVILKSCDFEGVHRMHVVLIIILRR